MGEVVRLQDFKSKIQPDIEQGQSDSLVPIEFAVGFAERNRCLAKLAEYGIGGIQVRMINNEPDALVYLMGVKDALWLNKKMLETEDLSEEAITERIDLIQMLENIDLPMMDSLWNSFTGKTP